MDNNNRRKYQREYMKRRYHEDPEFRQRIIDNSSSYIKNKLRTDPAFYAERVERLRRKKLKEFVDNFKKID
jgi:hypothetical protein